MRFISVLFLLLYLNLNAQVDTYSRQIIDSVIVYKDAKLSNTYYYAPNKLQVAVDNDGKPDFRLLKMRYMGTNCSGNAKEFHTTNLVKVRIKMPAFSSEKRKHIRAVLQKKAGYIKLKPLPVNNITSKLLIPMKSQEEPEKITMQSLGKMQATTAATNSGFTTRKSYWTERIFTFSLDNNEMVLLEKQLQEHALALSFSYAFYADATDPLAYSETKAAEKLKKEIIASKEEIPLVNRVIFSDAFAISIDIKKWPELIKQVDISDSMPPVYAAIEVKCYDFSENLRPELYLKLVDVSAVSIKDDKEITQQVKFYSKQPDINTHYIHFPYAVLLNAPFKYKVTEIFKDGTKKEGKWNTMESCNTLIDITTPPDALSCINETYEIEINPELLKDDKTKLMLKISYVLQGKSLQKLVVFDKNSPLDVKTEFYHDINTPVQYQYKVVNTENVLYTSKIIPSNDTYWYITAN